MSRWVEFDFYKLKKIKLSKLINFQQTYILYMAKKILTHKQINFGPTLEHLISDPHGTEPSEDRTQKKMNNQISKKPPFFKSVN